MNWRSGCKASLPDVMDLAKESSDTQSLYGINDDDTADFGRQCLLAVGSSRPA